MVPSQEHKREAPHVREQPDAFFETCKEPGRGHGLPQVPGGVHAQEAGGRHPNQCKPQQVLGSKSIQPTELFRVAYA